MKLISLVFFASALIVSVLAWTKEDYEIFDLVSDLEASEGKGTTFYSWLDLPSTATSSEISRAYRKKSLELHPDKNPGVKGIHERFARLGVIAQILRDAEARERYNFFYKNGVPKWRGTGYYYYRWRPGLGTVAVFLVILTTGLQYVVQTINHKRDVTRINRLISLAQSQVWGAKGLPIEGSRKVKVPLTEDQGSKTVDVVVNGQQVFLAEDNGPFNVLLDESLAHKPSLISTWAVSLIVRAAQPVMALFSRTHPPTTAGEVEEETEDSDAVVSAVLNGNGTARKPIGAAAIAGGRRRKPVRPVKKKMKGDKQDSGDVL